MAKKKTVSAVEQPAPAADKLARLITSTEEANKNKEAYERIAGPFCKEYATDCETLSALLDTLFDDQIRASREAISPDLKLWARHLTKIGKLSRKYRYWRGIVNESDRPEMLLLQAAADGADKDAIHQQLMHMRDAGILKERLNWQYISYHFPNTASFNWDRELQAAHPGVCKLMGQIIAPPVVQPKEEKERPPKAKPFCSPTPSPWFTSGTWARLWGVDSPATARKRLKDMEKEGKAERGVGRNWRISLEGLDKGFVDAILEEDKKRRDGVARRQMRARERKTAV